MPQFSLDSPCGICHKACMPTNDFARRRLPVGVSITCRFDEDDAEAIAYELRGVYEPAASRLDLRSFMRNAIRRALAEARERYEERSSEAERPSPSREGEMR